MATKKELASQLGHPEWADEYKRDTLVKMLEEHNAESPAEVENGLVTVYDVRTGHSLRVPATSAEPAVAVGQFSYTPVNDPRTEGN